MEHPKAAQLRALALEVYEDFMSQEQYRAGHDHFRSMVRTHITIEVSVGPDDEPGVSITHRDPKDDGVWTQLGRLECPEAARTDLKATSLPTGREVVRAA